MEEFYTLWAKKNPFWEVKFEEELIKVYTDHSIGSSELMLAKGKILGAGYELFIIAFFIGLYSNNTRDLKEPIKTLGQPIMYWGNLENKRFRKAYPKLRKYIFVSLIAKTDELDLLALEKGELSVEKAVNLLLDKMEKYANYGFYLIKSKIDDNPDYFFKQTRFIDLIISLNPQLMTDSDDGIEDL